MALDRRHMSLEALTAYGSDSDAEADDGGPRVPAQPRAQAFGLELLPAPRTAGGEPDAKKPRRFQLPLPVPRGNAAVAEDGESSDDEDAKRFAAARRGSGLLSSLPAPKNGPAASSREAAPASGSAYDDALARKSKNPKHMAAALFEKQMAAKRAEASQAAEGEAVAVGNTPTGTGCDSNAAAAHSASGAEGGAVQPPDAKQGAGALEAPLLPDGWGAAWDDTAKAYYYYNAAGATQWEPPVAHGRAYDVRPPPACVPSTESYEEAWMPEELRRELKKEAKRGGSGAACMPTLAAPLVTQSDFWQGEKHREYSAMSSAYHVPMNAPQKMQPGSLAKRKHQITDVLHTAAANELKYLDAAAAGRKSKAAVNARYGW